MKKLLLVLGLVVVMALPAFAQLNYRGTTVKKHRDDVTTVDTWFATAQTHPRTGSVELKGYNAVRIDANVTGDSVSIKGNLACSNDSLWVSGDSLTFTKDSYQDVDLQGCSDYYFNIDSISSGDRITIFLTPFSK